MSSSSTTSERTADLHEALAEIRACVQRATPVSSSSAPTLVAVSKYKPASDVQACYDAGQRDFGENYVQELVEKAQQLPSDIRWHFIGTLQSNKAKTLASIPNIHTVQTVTSAKAATALDRALPAERTAPLNVLLQVNTSGEDAKSGLAPLAPASEPQQEQRSELVTLAKHIITTCPRLRLRGLMTIGSLAESRQSDAENRDFATLCATRDALETVLGAEVGVPEEAGGAWGEGGKLLLSMGMSGDFEAALGAGSDVVRVGTGIFGERRKKAEV